LKETEDELQNMSDKYTQSQETLQEVQNLNEDISQEYENQLELKDKEIEEMTASYNAQIAELSTRLKQMEADNDSLSKRLDDLSDLEN